ncbi:MAG: GAF domain-containing sensor histidine kinase [Myxococcota bacterium]|jgi:signal transduction histidine kinase
MKESSSVNDWVGKTPIFEFFDEIIGFSSLDDIFDHMTRALTVKMKAGGATIFIAKPDTQELEARTMVHNVHRVIRLPINEHSLAGFCALNRRSITIRDAYADLSYIHPELHFDRSWDIVHDFRTRDVVCAPAILKDKVVGVIQILNSMEDGGFTEKHLEALDNIARLTGYALNQIRVYEDISSFKQLQKEKAKFVSVMIHELKSPIAAAKTLASVMKEGGLTEEQQSAFLDRICIRLDGMLDLIKDTMDFSLMHSGNMAGDVRVVDLRAAVQEVFNENRELAAHKQLAFTLEPGVDPVLVRIDIQGLRLIISNLISNAIKYTPKGSVEASVGTLEGKAIFSVRDTGLGVPAAEISELFKEFYRASNARKSKIEGSGVGLAGVKSMVERFGGEMRLVTRENEGSTFSVLLPIYNRQAECRVQADTSRG